MKKQQDQILKQRNDEENEEEIKQQMPPNDSNIQFNNYDGEEIIQTNEKDDMNNQILVAQIQQQQQNLLTTTNNDATDSDIKITSIFPIPLNEFIEALELTDINITKLLSNTDLKLTEQIFQFEVSAQKQNWILRKRLQHFFDLESKLKEDKKLNKIYFLVSLESLRELVKSNQISEPQHFQLFLDNYLQKLVQNEMIRNHQEFLQFLEISEVKYEGKKKFKEVFIIKRAGGRNREPSSIFRCKARCKCWDKRYLLITSEGVMYSRGRNGLSATIREFLLFDYNFNIEYGKQATGAETGIMLKTPARCLNIRTQNVFDFFDVLAALKLAYEQSKYAGLHRYDSFAPLRTNSICQWFIDAENYFESVCNSMMQAKNEIFITGWWVSPELYLRRPVGPVYNQEFRLDRVLQKKADQGVKIFIIVYKEQKIALDIDSEYTQKTLESLHPYNIHVLTHPNFILPFLWSHHEKLVIVDQEVGYLGGLDLCYGRYDSDRHELTEPDSIQKTEYLFPEIDYNNSRVKDISNVHKPQESNIDRNTQCRLPWHDIHVKVLGKPVKDMSKHFIQYWNFASVDIDPRDRKEFLLPKDKPGHENPFQPYLENINTRITGLKTQLEDYIKQKLLSKQVRQANQKEKDSLIDSNYAARDEHEQGKDIREDEEDRKSNQNEIQNPLHTLNADKTHYELYLDTLKLKKHPYSDIKHHAEEKEKPSQLQNLSNNKRQQQSFFKNYLEEIEDDDDGDNEADNPAEDDEIRPQHKKKGKERKKYISTYQNLPDVTSGGCVGVQMNSNDTFIPQQIYFPKSLRSSGLLTPQIHKKRLNQSVDYQLINPNLDPQFIVLLEQLKQIKQEDYKSTAFMEIGSHKSISDHESESMASSIESGLNFQTLAYFQQFFISQNHHESPHHVRSKINEGRQILKLSTKKFKKLKKEGTCTCQILRSASNWSLGLDTKNTEYSVQVAYLTLIAASKHFIYIENQFFISALAGPTVKNQVASALLQRIKKAAAQKEQFQVIVVLPLLPGFSGEIDDSNAGLMKVHLYWEYKSISRGGGSLIEELRKDPNIPDPFKYIFFFGLRTHGELQSQPLTEIIYVHSKLMIIDDDITITGSANINDRSMNGLRDSEIAIVIEDQKKVDSKMNKLPYKAGKFSQTLRTQLYQEHFDLRYDEVVDPLDEKLNQQIRKQAKYNQQLFEMIFACYPTNKVKQMSELEQYKKSGDLKKYNQLKENIKGNAVEWPLDFMENENLYFKINKAEYYIPEISFTQTICVSS